MFGTSRGTPRTLSLLPVEVLVVTSVRRGRFEFFPKLDEFFITFDAHSVIDTTIVFAIVMIVTPSVQVFIFYCRTSVKSVV